MVVFHERIVRIVALARCPFGRPYHSEVTFRRFRVKAMGDFNQNIAVSETYEPPKELNEHAHVKSMNEYEAMWKASIEDPENFWGEMAKQFYWQTPFEKVGPEFNFDRSQGPISVKWFQGGKTNLSYNCLDRNIEQGQGSRIAFYHECNDLEDQHASFTYDSRLQVFFFGGLVLREGQQDNQSGRILENVLYLSTSPKNRMVVSRKMGSHLGKKTNDHPKSCLGCPFIYLSFFLGGGCFKKKSRHEKDSDFLL